MNIYFVTVSYGDTNGVQEKSGYVQAEDADAASDWARNKVEAYPTTVKIWGTECHQTTRKVTDRELQNDLEMWDDYEEDEEDEEEYQSEDEEVLPTIKKLSWEDIVTPKGKENGVEMWRGEFITPLSFLRVSYHVSLLEGQYIWEGGLPMFRVPVKVSSIEEGKQKAQEDFERWVIDTFFDKQ